MEKLQEQIKNIKSILVFLSFVFGVLTTIVMQSYSMGKSVSTVATVSYVDAQLEKAIKFAQEQDKITLDAAKDWSNANKKDSMLAIQGQSADIKALSSKQDLILDSLRTLQAQMFESRRR